MATITQLSAVESLSPGDQVPVYKPGQGDTRKFSLTTLLTFLDGYFATQDDLDAIQLGGVLVPGKWFKLPAIYKLLLGGTGTVVIDTRDRSGVVTTAAATYSVSGQSEAFPYFAGAYEVRASLTGTATAEVI